MRQIFIILFTLISALSYGQISGRAAKGPVNRDTLAKLEALVVANPANTDAHIKYINYIGIDSEELVKQYEKWVNEFPKCATVPFALGEAYAKVESPKAKPWLLKAVATDPKFARAYYYLWIDGERWGDFNASREYLRLAMESDPSSPDYAFYYRSSFKNIDPERYKKGMYEMPKLFPGHERGAQSLYWLGLFVKENSEKEGIYKYLKENFPPGKSNWSSSGMYDYFYLLLETEPTKAQELATELEGVSTRENDKKSWGVRVKLAQDLIKINSLVAEKRFADAKLVADAVIQERRSAAAGLITLLKAELSDKSGETPSAYKNLVSFYAQTPQDDIMKALEMYGKKLGKGKKEIISDVWQIRDAAAVAATPFSLEQYFKPERAKLEDFKGKVILLTYWFPGCGPCRGEFPYFENVIKRFSKDEVVYLGINIVPEQDDYVIPFMKSSGYSFIPLKDEEDKRGNLVAPGAPTNYLIDGSGRIIFKNFRTDSDNERVLELMISETIERGKQKENNFEVKFKIDGVNPKGVFVTFFGEKDVATSEKIEANNGEFVFKGYTPSPMVARLSFSGEDRFLKRVGNGYIPYKSSSLWMVVYPGASFEVSGLLEGKDFLDIYPLDGGENDIFASLNSKMMPATNNMGNLTLKIRLDNTLTPEQKTEIESKIKAIEGEIASLKRDFLDKSANSLAALWLMEDMLIRSEISPPLFLQSCKRPY
jgi:thiol-disulfide isomerase/thioredoxin